VRRYLARTAQGRVPGHYQSEATSSKPRKSSNFEQRLAIHAPTTGIHPAKLLAFAGLIHAMDWPMNQTHAQGRGCGVSGCTMVAETLRGKARWTA